MKAWEGESGTESHDEGPGARACIHDSHKFPSVSVIRQFNRHLVLKKFNCRGAGTGSGLDKITR